MQYSSNNSFGVGFDVEDEDYFCGNLSFTLNEKTYTLSQFHFHSPVEHTKGSRYYPLEVHLVQIEPTSHDLGVLGVFLEVASENCPVPCNNSFLDIFWYHNKDNLFSGEPTYVDNSKYSLQPYSPFLPSRSSFFYYQGSLTTPPCSEGVQWIVYDEALAISADDVKIIRRAAGALKPILCQKMGIIIADQLQAKTM